MTSVIERLIAAYHLVRREIDRERRRPVPNRMRLARLRTERQAIKARLWRHIPRGETALRFVRAVLARLRYFHI